ncbi:MAG: nicotinate-nucleotide adenylyltransferase [Clostridia bacterium]|nr:nicotinate-nucleotide adenylyltransferase [Clostridia bacterium]
MGRIGIMGGTFDPIHNGHLVAAEAVRHHFSLSRVYFVPAARPPHKAAQAISAGRHRYAMAVLATCSNPAFFVSSEELDRDGTSYTIDTLRAFRSVFPDAELYFITGADAILQILHWKAPEELLATAHFIAVSRPGYPSQQLDQLRSRLPEQLRSRVLLQEIPALAISSSDIRERVRRGLPIRYLLPESVAQYIAKEGLYR